MKTFSSLCLSLVAFPAFASPIADFQAGSDLALRNIGGTYTYQDSASNISGQLLDSYFVAASKVSGSLNASTNLGTLFAQFATQGTLNLTGVAGGPNQMKWNVSGNTLVGKTLSLKIGVVTKSFTVSSVSGTFLVYGRHAVQPVPRLSDVGYTDTMLNQLVGDTLTLIGSVGGKPATLVLHPIVNGVGGNLVEQCVSYISFQGWTMVSGSSGVADLQLLQGATQYQTSTLSFMGAFTMPSQVVVPPTSEDKTFPVSANKVTGNSLGYLVASTAGFSTDFWVSIDPGFGVDTINNNTNVHPGQTINCSVWVYPAAPAGGIKVTLRCTDPNALLPSTVTIPEGGEGASFNFTASAAAVPFTKSLVMASFNGSVVSMQLNYY
jgi:hypothetical protein